MKIHLSIPPIDECKNEDSCGMTCVRCNRCGRFNGKKMPLYCEMPRELEQYLSERTKDRSDEDA